MENKEKSVEEILAEGQVFLRDAKRRSEVSSQKVKQLVEEGKRERVQFDRDMYDIARGKKPRETKPSIPDLDKHLTETRALIQRSKELGKSQRRLLDEMAANPLEKQVDAVFAQMGQKLYAVEQEELADASDANRYLSTEERSDAADEELERSGKPPPLRQVK